MTSVAYGTAFPASRGLLATRHYSTQAAAFFARLSKPSGWSDAQYEARKALYDAAIRKNVADGLWTKIAGLHVYAAADLATALTNAVSSSYGGTAVNNPAFAADRGFTGDGATAYIDSGYNVSTYPGQFSQNSATMFAWVLSAGTIGGIGGTFSSSNGRTYITSITSGRFYLGANTTTTLLQGPTADGTGLWTVSRTAANLTTGYRNTTSLGTDNTASAVGANGTLRALSHSGGYSDPQLAMFGFGSGFTATDVTNFYNAWYPYLQSVGAVP